jgi:Protein of unknown function (DUF1064)
MRNFKNSKKKKERQSLLEKTYGKTNKYKNKFTWVDGIRFSSKKEANRYCELKLLEQQEEIFELKLQPRFKFELRGVLICTYVADFMYDDPDRGYVIEDAKGYHTEVYNLKKKLMKAFYGIDIVEI